LVRTDLLLDIDPPVLWEDFPPQFIHNAAPILASTIVLNFNINLQNIKTDRSRFSSKETIGFLINKTLLKVYPTVKKRSIKIKLGYPESRGNLSEERLIAGCFVLRHPQWLAK
jgi:hypothetical protein